MHIFESDSVQNHSRKSRPSMPSESGGGLAQFGVTMDAIGPITYTTRRQTQIFG